MPDPQPVNTTSQDVATIATGTQAVSMLDRAISGGITWLVVDILHRLQTAGYISAGDVSQLSPILILLLLAGWGYYAARPKAIVQAAASLPGTTVITTKTLSEATPKQDNIVSNLETKVVNK